MCVFCTVGGGSVLSLAGWKVGVCLVPVMISDSKRGSARERERRRVAASIKDWKRQFAERQRHRTRDKVGVGEAEKGEGEKERLSNALY